MALVDMSGEQLQLEPTTADSSTLVSAEINQQIATARRYPRSVARARQQALQLATLTEDTARRCVYALPRAGKKIEGPSARLAEIVASSWGNCRFGARVVGETDNFIIAQGVFHDLETNAAVTVEVQRRITDSKGRRYDVDMIGVTGAAACSIALRNAVFKGVPQALWFDIFQAAQKTILGDRKTLAQRRNMALDAFKPYGVVEQQIYAALDVGGVSDITLEHLATLAGFLTSIEEGADPEEIFPPVETKTKPREKAPEAPKPPQNTSGPSAPLAQGPASSAPPPPPAAEQPSSPVDGGGEDFTQLEMSIADTLADVRAPSEIDAVAAMFAQDIAEASADVRARIAQQFADAKQGRAA
jgi:hypothetical protein